MSFRITNVSSVPHRSPFRYPGGKTWLVPLIRKWLRSLNPPIGELVEPFAGGAIVGLSAVFENLARRVTLVELDAEVAAVWHTILNGHAHRLADELAQFDISLEAVKALMSVHQPSVYGQAFATLVKNRAQRGGILAPGASLMKNGERGRGVSSRWYPATLKRRILAIAQVRERIRFFESDGLEYLRKRAGDKSAVYFIDPPYTVAGRRLYRHSDISHRELFNIADTLLGDFLMTYDNTAEVGELVDSHGFDKEAIPMKNTHHERKTELLIGRDLSWLHRISA